MPAEFVNGWGTSVSTTQRPTVLIVDDDPAIRSLLAELVDVVRPEVTVVGTACNGEEAVESARELQPDIIIMDVRMPVMDGIQASRAINDEGGRAEIILFTSYEWSELRSQGLAAGAHHFLKKPFQIDALERALDHAVAAVRSRKGNAEREATEAGGH